MLQHRLEMAALAGFSLFIGLLFFTLLRPQGIGLDFYFPGLPEPRAWMSAVILDSFPSFIHMLAHTFACYAVLASSRALYVATSLFLLATTIACELMTGVFDPLDVIAALMGTVMAMGMIELRIHPFSARLISRVATARGRHESSYSSASDART